MKFKLRLSRPALLRAWGVSSVAALALFLVFRCLEAVLTARTGFGIADMQYTSDALVVRTILDHWQMSRDAGLAGLLFGLDFLFILVYGTALYFGALAAREIFAAKPSGRRRLFDALTAAPLLAVAGDLIANGLHATMMQIGAVPTLATLAFEGALVNAAGALIGVVLSLAAAISWLGRRKRAETS